MICEELLHVQMKVKAMTNSEVRSTSHGGDTPLMSANFGPKYDQHLDEMRKKLAQEDNKHQNLRRMCDNHMYEEERYWQADLRMGFSSQSTN